MSDARDDWWLSVAAIKKELAERSVFRPAEIDDLLRAAVIGDRVCIRFGDGAAGQEVRWADIKDRRYNDSALHRQRQDAANAGPRRNPFDRRRGEKPCPPAPRAACPTGYDKFCNDPGARLNLRKVMDFIKVYHGTEFDPLPAEQDALDLDAPSPKKPGRREDKIWDDVKDDLLLWLDRNWVPDVKNKLVGWVQNWFFNRGYEQPGSSRVGKGKERAPSESTIKTKVDEVLARYEASRKRQKEHLTQL